MISNRRASGCSQGGHARNQKNVYTVKLDSLQARALYDLCLRKHFDRYEVAYAKFAFREAGLNIVYYASGTLVLQGKKTEDFIAFELEPYVLLHPSYGYDEITHPSWFEPHAGMDESGKGDLFGPLVTACVIADSEAIKSWISDGVKDSKRIGNHNTIMTMEKKIIKSAAAYHVMSLSMATYNDLYIKFGRNLNILLGWQHACSLKHALHKHKVSWGLLDQFSKQPIVQRFFRSEGFELRMQTKAEADPVVAAASILARAEYSRQMDFLSKLAGFTIRKGASQLVTQQAKDIADKFGYDALKNFIKMHFATAPRLV